MSEVRFLIAACEHCGGHIEFPAHGVGAKVACPHCSNETVLVEEAQDAPVPQEEITAGELQAALQSPVSRRRISLCYQAGLLLVAIFMVLLPLPYIALAALLSYYVCWYAVRAPGFLFSNFSGGLYGMFFRVIAYIGPLIAGGVAVFFMFKPLLARCPKRAEPLELDPSQHPRLYQFITHLSDQLHVSMPRRIYLDCELNASAGFRRGWFSILGNDLVLTLGLPLVAGVNTRQLAAVVAHELGHCTQALAMRLGFVINSVDRWFMRVVYERDSWDVAFEEWSNAVADSGLTVIAICPKVAVWFFRRVLALLMFIGHAASCFLARQMEFHADACAMSVAGSAGLESLLIRLRELMVLEHLAYDGLQQFWREGHQLPNSVPDFLEQLEQRLPPEFHTQAQHTLLNETAGLFVTHPTAAQRIRKARQRGEQGIFALEKPARALFSDFAGTAQVVTARHYRHTLRLAVTAPMLKPVSAFFRESA